MADLIDQWPAARTVIARRGMACVGCVMAPFETVAEAAEAYGFDAGEFIREVAGDVPSALQTARRLRRRKDASPRPHDHSRKRRFSS